MKFCYSQKMVDAITLEKLESGYKKLAVSDSKSLLKKYLTQEIFDKLKVLKTPTFGSTLLDVIQSGMLSVCYVNCNYAWNHLTLFTPYDPGGTVKLN